MGGWVQISLEQKKLEIVPKCSYTSADILELYTVYFVILFFVSRDLGVLSMSMMGFQKVWIGRDLSSFFNFVNFISQQICSEKHDDVKAVVQNALGEVCVKHTSWEKYGQNEIYIY